MNNSEPLVLGIGKRELVMNSRVMPASGALGWAPTPPGSFDGAGAFVTPEMFWEQSRGDEQRRLYRVPGGVVVSPGDYNPGLPHAFSKYGRLWQGLDLPIIAAIRIAAEDSLLDIANWLSRNRVFAAIELHLDQAEMVSLALDVLEPRVGLPILVRLSPIFAQDMAQMAADGGADALVCAAPLPALVPKQTTMGVLHGSGTWPFYTGLFLEVQQSTDLPVIARGGIASTQDALWYLENGAAAVQIDALLYREPDALAQVSARINETL